MLLLHLALMVCWQQARLLLQLSPCPLLLSPSPAAMQQDNHNSTQQ
jgi:hypothetical protein